MNTPAIEKSHLYFASMAIPFGMIAWLLLIALLQPVEGAREAPFEGASVIVSKELRAP